jgi:hypothetical protein
VLRAKEDIKMNLYISTKVSSLEREREMRNYLLRDLGTDVLIVIHC